MYKHVSGLFQEEIVINKSRFIGTCNFVSSEEEAKAFVESVRKKYSDATHNCFAYIFDTLGNALKFSDDGEPKGTAGMPILEVIRNKNLVHSAVVVTRYFGGIKLGAGGLVRAYTDAAVSVLNKAKICVVEKAITLRARLDYSLFKLIEAYLKEQEKLVIKEVQYQEDVRITAVCLAENFESIKKELIDLSLGKCEIEKLDEGYFSF